MQEKYNCKQLTTKKNNKFLKIMKIYFLITLFCIFSATAENTYSQSKTVSAELRNVTLQEAFREIEKNSDYLFLIMDDTGNELSKKIDVSVDNKSIIEILDHLLKNTHLSYSIVNRQITISKDPARDSSLEKDSTGEEIVQQSKRVIKGKVTDLQGEAIIGANIIEKETFNGTITDMDGLFSLSVDNNATITVSYIGYVSQEVNVSNQNTFHFVLLEDTEMLDEVVVVGYGVQKKSDITGSIASLNPEILQERPQTNVIQALQGTIPGVNVTTTNSGAEDNATLLIRGQNSITASNSPLVVLDGIPYSGNLSELNPNDIASIEVLKDASSTAIYGSRGANGVILITTKTGEAGKIKVAYNGYYSWDEIAHLPDMQDANDFWRDEWERRITNQLSMPTSTSSVRQQIDEVFIGDENSNTNLAAFMMGYPGRTWDQVKNEILSKYPEYVHDYSILQEIATDFAYPAGGRNTDWIDLATRTGHRQQHNVSLSGGGESSKYYVSALYGNTQGIALGDDFQKMVFRVNMNLRLWDGINYGTNTQLGFYDRSGSKAQWGGLTNNGALLLSPLYNAYNEDGSIDLYPIKEDTRRKNPLEPLLFDTMDKSTVVITNHYLDVDIPWVPGLHYKLNTGYTWDNARNRSYKGMNTTEGIVENGILNTVDANGYSWIVENIVSYVRVFGKHNLFLTALYSAQENSKEQNQINGRGFASDVMGYYQASQASILTAKSNYVKSSHLSQMARLNYGFDERYLLTATIRRDGYSAFGRTTKFGTFPSLALGWNIANENFLRSFRELDVLKVRLSYGENGNEAVSAYSTLPVLSSLDYIDETGKILYGYYPEALENPGLSWETTKSYNLGLDFSFFKGRVNGVIDTYKSRTSNLLLRETISAINGTTSITRNIGETKNNGLEFMLSTVNVDKKNFLWKTDFNFATYNSKIVHVGLKDSDGNYIDDVASEWFIGHPVNVNFDYSLDRILQKEDFMLDANGDYILNENNNYILKEEIQNQIVVFGTPFPGKPVVKDVNGDGIIGGSEDKEIHGSLSPDFIAGMTNTIKYKNWTFSFFFNGVWGVTKKNDLINMRSLGPDRKMNLTYWTPSNPINELPGINYGSLTQEELYPYFDANFIRLQDVSLTYNFPSTVLSKLSFSELAAFVNMKNVATFTKWKGLDPEYTVQSDVPRPRSFILGLRFAF